MPRSESISRTRHPRLARRAGQQTWMPPEAAAAAVAEAERQSIWSCSACTLVNASNAATCHACGAVRQPADSSQGRHGEGVDLAAADRQGPSTPTSANGKGKQKKLPKFERLRVTGGDAHATQQWLEASGAVPVRPQNAWTQKRTPSEFVGRSSGPVDAPQQPPVKNRWAASPGQFAHQARATQDAWARR